MSRRRATVSSGVVLGLVVVCGLFWSVVGWQAPQDVAPEKLLPAKPVFLYSFFGPVGGVADVGVGAEASADGQLHGIGA